MSVNDPQTRLGHMLDMAIAASEIAASTTYDEFLDSLMHQLAIVRALEVTGEAVAHVDQETRDSISGIPWS